MSNTRQDTASKTYTDRLVRYESVWWKRIFNVQMPYKLHLNSLKPGFMLEIGCGIGRNLRHINGNGVGVDHNATSIGVARTAGLKAFTPAEFEASSYAQGEKFDSLLLAHVLEHMDFNSGKNLIAQHLRYLKRNAQIILICPQRAGYASDATHVEYMDRPKLERMLSELNISVKKSYSFPFPEFVGDFFKYNEHIVIGVKR